jgi:hypothetical protein
MSPLFYLASDFIERMSNPRYGTRENEEYALKFAAFLRNKGFEDILGVEAGRISDVNTLTPYGWLWLLGWARSENVHMNEKLLLELMEQWQSRFTMALIIEVATQQVQWAGSGISTDMYQFDNPWLLNLMIKCVSTPGNNDREPEGTPDTNFAQSVLIALMQAGSAISLDAASALLNHEWEGQQRLLQYFEAQLSLLDEETRQEWNTRLRPQSGYDRR